MMTEQEFSTAVRNMRRRTTRMEREGDYWTEDDKELLVRLFDAGIGITEMALQLQRTEPAVQQQIEKMDLYQRKENPKRQRFHKELPGCLCERCSCDPAACPRYEDCKGNQEG